MEKLDLRLCTPQSLTFCTFSSEEIKKLSVANIITPLSFNAVGHPLPGGLYDPALGPFDSSGLCSTCKMKMYQCPGHFGCIELPLVVVNPLYHKVIVNIFKISCLDCHTILLPTFTKYVLSNQIKLLDKGFIIEASELSSTHRSYMAAFWDSAISQNYDVGFELSLITKLEQEVRDILQNGSLIHIEIKGEGDLRKKFLDDALSYVFKGKKCPWCKADLTKVQALRNKIIVNENKVKIATKFNNATEKNSPKSSSSLKTLTPKECHFRLNKIFQNDGETIKAMIPMLGITNEADPVDSLFMKYILVSPTNSRPCNYLNGLITEHPQNSVYKAILNDCLILRSIILLMNDGDGKEELAAERKEVVEKLRGNDYSEKLLFAWYGLQENVDSLLDIEAKKVSLGKNAPGIGLKQIIEKKQGILRMNMMGKRVNFAARTVITPDPNLNIDEIGIPEDFAKKLTYPVVVTVWNVEELRKLVINGPDVHPGANFIVDEMKKIIKIDKYDAIQRESIAKRLLTPGDKPGYKVVHRHLINGDILLLNRQPTLHRPSIMAHRARILKGEKTFRLHYANCKSYNADFDGDEMNAHFPQNEVARSEGYNLVSVNKQYLVPKDGTPLSGLIQDHVVSGVKLSIRGKMFTKGQYMQLIFQALSNLQGDIITLKPCFLKPVELWSGKQVISTVLLNVIPKGKVPINLTSKAKISQKAWLKGPSRPWLAGGTPFKNDIVMSEAEVVIRGGELLSGVLDKTHYGATPYSLVHCMYELYGGDVSSAFLSALAKLFTAFLQMEGFTLGVEDILVLSDADNKRKKIIHKVRNIGDEIVSGMLYVPQGSSLKEEIAHMYAKDPMFQAVLDHKYKTSLDDYTNNINKTCIPKGLLSPFPDNNLQLMVQSGAKGSTVNTMQISCLLGQIELEGKRPPLMISGKSLPSFPYFDTSPRAGGFVDGRFMTGIKPQEFFFHCMAGREGLIDTAVKTSRSGYLQRCLVKHLEGLNVNYDMTVRDSDGSVIQFLYGEDGLEVTKCQFLKENQMPFLFDNMYAIHDVEMVNSIKEHSELSAIKAYNKIIKKWRKQNVFGKIRRSGFSIFTEEMKYSIGKANNIVQGVGRSSLTMELCKLWNNLSPEEKAEYEKRCLKTPDTLVSRFQPDRNYGALTEKMDQLISDYYEQRKGDLKEKTIRNIINEKVLTAVCPPGEPVGLLAAQSVGEPSTQMTLNTFHFAGRGEMNVTLGIPRLREILMIASKNIKTPSMVIYFKEVPKLDHLVNKLRKKMTRISLADVLEKIHVHEEINVHSGKKVYTVTMHFLPHEAYKDNTSVTPKQILKYVEKRFMKILINKLHSKKSNAKDLILVEDVAVGSKGANNSDDEEEEKAEKKVPKQQNVGIADDYQSSEDEPEGDDDDATTAKIRTKHKEEYQYSDAEDDASVQEEVGEGGEEDDVWGTAEEKIKQEETEEEADRKANVISENAITDYTYDPLKEEWCKIVFEMNFQFVTDHVDISSTLKELCRKSIVHEIRGIRKAYIQADKKTGKPILRTDGINFSDIFQKDKIIDVNKLYSNDIHAMANIYGIEAASSIIVKEVQDVFKGYGITVDTRHLNLVASYMTFSGVYLPLSRKGMEGGASPLQQMSFESSLGFLKMAVTRKRTDDLCSPSSRLMMGAPVKSGTGSFRLLQKIQS